MIQIEHLTKEYLSGKKAIDDISFDVKTGEIFGFLGPNGAGKTTTIKILTTLLRPTTGKARVAGHDVVANPFAVRMSFGYVGQQSGVDPSLSVRENLLLQGKLYHLSSSVLEERINDVARVLEIKEISGLWVGTLSGGMKRKLDIAMALIHEPKLLFLDEPTLGLDPQSRSDLWSYLRRLNREEGVTLFLTTHYLDEVDQLANRVGILNHGKLQKIGTPDELKDSLGADCIQLTFKQPLSEGVVAFFQQKEPIKNIICHENRLRLYLENGKGMLPRVLQWIDEQGLTAETVTLTRPTFDDVFLKYAGKNFSDEDEKKDASAEWGWGKKWNKEDGNNEWAKKWQKEGNAGQEWGSEWKAGENKKEDWGRQWKKEGPIPAADTPIGEAKAKETKDKANAEKSPEEKSPKEKWPNENWAKGKPPEGEWPKGDWKKDTQWNKK
ncbi:MAG: ATP-binding cassette domain-containing protein [Candidatus Manganitrophaceae bacterium]